MQSEKKTNPIPQALPPPTEKELKLESISTIVELHKEQLIRIFTYYCSFGEPLNTNKMRSSKFIKMLKDGKLIESVDNFAPAIKKGSIK